jgi:hypothetical protein
VSDLNRYRTELGLETEATVPPLFPKDKKPVAVIPPVPQAVDPVREQLGLETSPMYARSKGAIPQEPAPEDPSINLMRLLAAADDPVAEMTRINATQYIAKTFDLDPAKTYTNLEELSQAWLGKIAPAPVFAQALRDAWDNGMKNYDIGKLALQLRESGGQDPAMIKGLEALEAAIVPLTEIPRPWIKNALLWATESTPLMAQSFLRGGIMGAGAGAVAGLTLAATPMGLAAAGVTEGMSVPAITLAMASVGFAVGSTQDIIQVMRGLAYWRMIKAQVPHNIAAPLSDIEGIVEGAIESVGQILLGVKLPGITPALKSAGTLIANKMMATGVVGAVATRLAGQAVGAALGEGIEEPLQELTSIFTDLAARELAKNQDVLTTIAPMTTKEAARRIGQAFYGGVSAGLIFGVSGAPAGLRADVRQLSSIRDLAKKMPSRLGFIGSVMRGDHVLQGTGVSDAAWRTYLGKVWDQQHPGKEQAAAAAPAQAAPGAQGAQAAAPVRGPEGRVHTELETLTRGKQGVVALLKAGDPTTGKRYGFISFETIGERIYVEDVVNETEQDLRRELLLDLAARYPGQEIEWNPTDELDVALKEDLVATNPLGPERGLQRFEVARPEAQATAQQDLTRGLFVERMGQLFNATTPEQAELFGKLSDTFAQVSGQSTQDWLRQFISPEVALVTPEAAAELKERTGIAGTRFRVGGEFIAPLTVDQFKGQVKALFTALGKADFHHGVHEFFHAVERLALSPDQVKKFETALGKLRQTWTVDDIEDLADRFEDYLATGKAPTPELQSVFQQIAAALRAVLSFIRERLGKEPELLSQEFQAAYDSLMKKPDSGLAQATAEVPAPAAPAVEVSQVEEGVPPSTEGAATIISPSAVPPVEVELSRITLSAEVPNFKELADRRGIIEALKGEEYVKVGIPPIVLWERQDGRLEVITGRHRLDLAQRLKLPTILSQIVREADGFTAAMAMSFDAEANIRDGQGSVRDYANYFRARQVTEQEASRRGLLDRHKGRSGFAIGRYASDGLYSLYRNDQITEAKAAAIAAASLGDERLQSLGITKAKKLSADELGNFLALARQTVTTAGGAQGDMFGFDDSLIREGEAIAKAVSAKKAELLQERQALSSAVRLSRGAQAKIVEKYGFKAGDVAAIQNRVDALGEELQTWESWTQDPEKMREARQLAGLPVAAQALLHPEEGEPPGFDLVPWDDKLLRPKAPDVQPIFDFAEKQEIRIADWEKTKEGWKHVSGAMADKQTAVTLERLKDDADNLSLFHRDPELQKKFNAAAVEVFGTTDNQKHASWILSDGRMLDFSWEKHQGEGYWKYHDRIGHIGIELVFPQLKKSKELGAEWADKQPPAYEAAWQAGALRMDVGIMGELAIQSTMIPTDEQMKVIEYLIAGKELMVMELSSAEGEARTIGWENLMQPTMQDVRRFYAKMAPQVDAQAVTQLFHKEIPQEDLEEHDRTIAALEAIIPIAEEQPGSGIEIERRFRDFQMKENRKILAVLKDERSRRSAILFESPDRSKFHILFPATRPGARWQISFFDKYGPFSHTLFVSHVKALKHAMSEDYRISATQEVPASVFADMRFRRTEMDLDAGKAYDKALFHVDEEIKQALIEEGVSVQNALALMEGKKNIRQVIRETLQIHEAPNRSVRSEVLGITEDLEEYESHRSAIDAAFEQAFERIERILEGSILFHPEDWQGEFLYGTAVDAEIYQQYVELAKGFESAEAFRADIEGKYGEPGDADLAGEKAQRFYEEVWEEAHKPEPPAPATVPIQSPVLPSAPTYDYQAKVEAAKDIENPELAAKAVTGDLTEAEIEELALDALGLTAEVETTAKEQVEAAEEVLGSLTAEEQVAVKAGEELETAMAEREQKTGKQEQLEAIERRIKSLRTRLRNALAGNAHVALIMQEQGAWKRILAKEAPVEEAQAYTEGIVFGREIQKLIDEEKAKAERKASRVKFYAEKKAAVARTKEGMRKAAAQRRAAKKLRDARKKLLKDIMRPPGRGIQFRGYAEQIREIQRGLDPVKRQKQTVYSREQWRKFFDEHPEAAALMRKEELDRIYSVPLSKMTMAELERVAEILDGLRRTGSLMRFLEVQAKFRQRAELKNRLSAAVLRGEEPEKPVGGVKPTPLLLKGLISSWKPNRVLALLDGVFAGQEKGAFSELGQKRVNEAWGAYKKAVRVRMEKVVNKAKELGFSFDQVSAKKGLEWVGRDFDIDGFRYTNGKLPTLQEVMYWHIGIQNQRTFAALVTSPEGLPRGNNLPLTVVLKGIGKLTEKERALADTIAEDFERNFPRLRDAYIDIFNEDLPGESHYVPMRRKEISFETRQDEVAAELTGRAGLRRQYIARGPTHERIDIADVHQKPIRTDLINLWVEGVKIQEGFIHQDTIIKEMHRSLESDQVREAITQKYGPELNHWLSKYINDLAQAEAYVSMSGLERLSRMGRAHATIAWLGFNLLSMAKQAVGSLGYMADLGPLAPVYLLSATAQFAAGQVKAIAGGHIFSNTLVEFVRARSELVRNRQISEELENLKRTNVGLYNNIVGKIGRWGMKGLEIMDITTVSIGWKAVYDKILRETDGDELKAIEAADEATLRSQPSARVQDMAQIYRMGELAKWFTMFTSELNAIWNRLSFDVPLALRRKEFLRAMADVTSIAMAGMFIALASGALQGDDEEKKRKRLLLGLASEFVESWPIVGNDVFSILSDKRFQSGGVKLVPAVSAATETFKQVTEGDWDTALKNMLETLSFAMGLPYAGPRRAIKAIRTGDVRALLGWPEEKK